MNELFWLGIKSLLLIMSVIACDWLFESNFTRKTNLKTNLLVKTPFKLISVLLRRGGLAHYTLDSIMLCTEVLCLFLNSSQLSDTETDIN